MERLKELEAIFKLFSNEDNFLNAVDNMLDDLQSRVTDIINSGVPGNSYQLGIIVVAEMMATLLHQGVDKELRAAVVRDTFVSVLHTIQFFDSIDPE